MRFILLLLVFFSLLPITMSEDCNTACLSLGYTSGKCTENCTDNKIEGGKDCSLSGSAILLISTDTADVYSNLDSFIDEDTKNPKFAWIIKNIRTKGITSTANTNDETKHTGPIIGIKNSFIANDIDSIDVPAKGIGESFCFPKNVICVKFKGLTVSKYASYKIEKTTVDLSSFNSSWTNKAAVLIYSINEADGLKLDTAGYSMANATSGIKTDSIWIVFNNTDSYAGIFYRDSASNIKKAAGYLNMNSGSVDINVADVNYLNTKDSMVQIDLRGDFGTSDNLDIVLDVQGTEGYVSTDNRDDITINLKHSANSDFSGFGNTSSTADESDVVWQSTNIGTKEVDLRSVYGIIIQTPKTSLALDKINFLIPGDQVKAIIEITRKSSSITKTVYSSKTSVGSEIPSPILESSLKFKEDNNLILIGGPCANKIVESFPEFPKCKGWPLKKGEAMIKYAVNGENSALLVAGTDEEDTSAAVAILNSFNDFNLNGIDVIIKNKIPKIIQTDSSKIDLSDYPYPFLKDGKPQNMLIIVGNKASDLDAVSSQELTNSLLWLTRESIILTNVTETLNTSTSITDEVPLGNSLTDTPFFNPSLTSYDIPSLIRSKFHFKNKETRFHEELLLYNGGPSLQTSLSSSDTSYKSNVYLEASSGSLRYYYIFDDEIDLSDSSIDLPLSINFLDTPISITSAETQTKLKSQIGKEYFLNIGDKLKVNNVDVKLLDTVEEGAVLLEVNNTKKILAEDKSWYNNGIEIVNLGTFKQLKTECCCSNLLKFL